MRLHFFSAAMVGATFFAATPAKTQPLPPKELTEVWEPKPPVVDTTGTMPADAIALFDGNSLENWTAEKDGPARWTLDRDGALTILPGSGGIRTRAAFGDAQLHLEFRMPAVAEGDGQQRGNSGVFFMGLYELQLLDSYRNDTYANGQLGSIYKQAIPLANPARPPGDWQTLDAIFTAPRFAADGSLLSPARLTAFINGVLVQRDFVLRGPTVHRGHPAYKPHAAELPLLLQEHRDFVSFRNIWIRPLPPPDSAP